MAVKADRALELFDPLAALSEHEQRARELGAARLPDRRFLGAALLLGRLSEDQAVELLELGRANNTQVARLAAEHTKLAPSDLFEIRAIAAGVRFIAADALKVHVKALQVLPVEVARSQKALPFRVEPPPADAPDEHKGTVWIALAEPTGQARELINGLLRPQGWTPQYVAALPEVIDRLIVNRYAILTAENNRNPDQEPDNKELLTASDDDGPARQYILQVLTEALEHRASDIHIEPNSDATTKGLIIRYRVDGVTRVLGEVPEQYRAAFINALKIDNGLDIAKSRVFDSGRSSKVFEGRRIDFRCELVPTEGGESMVLRILDREGLSMNLADMGFSKRNLERFQAVYRKPHGAILVTGPTGSGKTSTLYAVLTELNDPEVVIFTIEDPVEYKQEGVQHIEVKAGEGRSFAGALRSVLRADPDIIMVGEIRDSETAQIAMRATTTGHMVLSTLHTTEAAEAPIQLLQMGVEPFVVAGALSCVVTQRLVRRLCESCKEPYVPDLEELIDVGYDEDTAKKIRSEVDQYNVHRASESGCRECGGLSYRGRVAVHEVLIVDTEIRRNILSVDRSAHQLRLLAQQRGMTTMKADGLEKAWQGLTSLTEVRRVLG